jgi:hypothetical protein
LADELWEVIVERAAACKALMDVPAGEEPAEAQALKVLAHDFVKEMKLKKMKKLNQKVKLTQ